MKHIAIFIAIFSLLPRLGAGEENMLPIASFYDELELAQGVPENGASHSISNVKAAPKPHRHGHANCPSSITLSQTKSKPRNGNGASRRKSLPASFPGRLHALTPLQRAGDETDEPRIESFYAYELSFCRPWWKWVPSCSKNDDARAGIDLQALSVLNQSPGGQRPYFSLDLSTSAVARDWDLWSEDFPSKCNRSVSIAVLEEPDLGVTLSMHFRDPGDKTKTPPQTQGLTIHPLLSAQINLLNLSIYKQKAEEPWLEFMLANGPLLDLYGRFTGTEAQFQWALQPSVEWHLDKKTLSAFFQVSIPLFTVGGRNSPPSFAIGILWHEVNP